MASDVLELRVNIREYLSRGYSPEDVRTLFEDILRRFGREDHFDHAVLEDRNVDLQEECA